MTYLLCTLYVFFYLTEAQIAERRTREYQEKEHDIAVARELVSKTFFDSYCTAILRKKDSGFMHISNTISFHCFQNQYEGNQWGRPGPGGPYWRERTLTGQGFFEKMVNNYYTVFKQQTLEA